MKIPSNALNQHIAILGKTGSGKTFAAKGIVESLLDQGRQVCVIDPTSAWYGLRLSASGKSAGFNIVLLGGKHGDIPLSARTGAAVANLVTQQRASVVVDTSSMTVGEYTQWFIDFAGTLYTTIRNPLHLVIDEAHYFMPQGKAPDPQAGRMIHAGNRLMSGGRSLGIRGMMITQRPAKLHKDSLTCADTLIAMRVIAPQDRAAIREWIDGAGDSDQGREVLNSLAQLGRGEGWVWYPEGGHLERVKFPAIKTYDSSATPKHGEQAASPKISDINLAEVKAAMAQAVEEAKNNDPAELRKQLAELRKQLASKPLANVETKVVEKPVVTDQQVKRVESIVDRLEREGEKRIKAGERLIESGNDLKTVGREFAAALKRTNVPPPASPARVAPPRVVAASRPTSTGDSEVGKGGLRRILIVLAQRPGLTNAQIGLRAGLSSKSGSFGTYMSTARKNGWIIDEGERRLITDAGLQALGGYEPLPEGPALLQYWINELGNSGAARILSAVAEAFPGSLTNEQIGERAQMSSSSGSFGTYMSTLRRLELVTSSRGMTRASEELFEAAQ